jgi:hypothetical protein
VFATTSASPPSIGLTGTLIKKNWLTEQGTRDLVGRTHPSSMQCRITFTSYSTNSIHIHVLHALNCWGTTVIVHSSHPSPKKRKHSSRGIAVIQIISYGMYENNSLQHIDILEQIPAG